MYPQIRNYSGSGYSTGRVYITHEEVRRGEMSSEMEKAPSGKNDEGNIVGK